MTIADIMRREVIRVSPDTGLKTLLALHESLSPFQIHVVDPGGVLLGVISAYDLIRLMIPGYLLGEFGGNLGGVTSEDLDLVRKRAREQMGKTAKDIMAAEIEFLRPDDPCLKADVLLVGRKYNSMPVLDEAGVLLGELTRRDVLRYLATQVVE